MKKLGTTLANAYGIVVIWGLYCLCYAAWWLLSVGLPIAGRWLAVAMLARVLDLIAAASWLSRAARKPRAAAVEVRQWVIDGGTVVCEAIAHLIMQVQRASHYAGRCQPRPCFVGLDLVPDEPIIVEPSPTPTLSPSSAPVLTMPSAAQVTEEQLAEVYEDPAYLDWLEQQTEADEVRQEEPPAVVEDVPKWSARGDQLDHAIAFIAQGLSRRAAAREAGIPESTLRRKMKAAGITEAKIAEMRQMQLNDVA